MKKITFILTMLSIALFSAAQNYGDIEGSILINNYKKAKEELDKRMTNAKFISKPNAYLLKARIYSALATDSTLADDAARKMNQDADEAFAKYKEMDPGLELLKEMVYKDAPLYIYSNLFGYGQQDLNSEKWEQAYNTFKKVEGYSNLLAQQNLLNSPLDTAVYLYAGYTAERAGKTEEAVKHYMKLADANVGEGYENVYNFLVIHYFKKNDLANFEKYRQQGLRLFPQSEFFKNDQSDFAVGLDVNFSNQMKSLEAVLSKDPNDFKANFALGRLIFDTLYSTVDGAVPPANAAELETKMVDAFNKGIAADPNHDIILLFLGDHYVQKANKVVDDISKLENEINKKPGAKASKEETARLAELNKTYADLDEQTRIPYEKAAAIYAAKSTLSANEKQQYRNVAGFLGDIYTRKREAAEAKKSPDAKKLEAEEKKWNDLYMVLGKRN